MSDPTGIAAYKQGHIEVQAAAASPIEQVLMLMSGFIDELDRLHGHIVSGSSDKKAGSVTILMNILDVLDTSLDMEQGGKLAQDIHDQYTDTGNRVFKASQDNDTEQLTVAKKVMTTLKEGWEGVEKNLR